MFTQEPGEHRLSLPSGLEEAAMKAKGEHGLRRCWLFHSRKKLRTDPEELFRHHYYPITKKKKKSNLPFCRGNLCFGLDPRPQLPKVSRVNTAEWGCEVQGTSSPGSRVPCLTSYQHGLGVSRWQFKQPVWL